LRQRDQPDIALAVVNDTLDELNETVLVTVSNPTNATLGAIPTHTYTITTMILRRQSG